MRPPLAALCLLLVPLTYAGLGSGHECELVTPQRVGYSATTSSRARREVTERQPIRIKPVYFEEDFNQLSPELNTTFKSAVEEAINFLSSFLKVDRLIQNITLQRFCNASVQLQSLNPFDHCTPNEPCQATFCVRPDFPIPEDHLKACKTCDTFGSTNCSTEGQDGPGVADADIVIYVASRSCEEGVLGFASHCFMDKSTDRPIAGLINLCPRLAEREFEDIVLVVAHELTHALVFNRLLFPFYRDENGNPRTPRNETTGLPPFGNSTIFLFQPSAETILQEVVQREALNGVHNIDTVKMVTPAVLREARNHFGCPTLNGMELENQGGPGTTFSHWKKRLVENEGMTGVLSINGVFSRLTFALFEDSGWYDVDYSVASPLRFGQCLGCDFAEKSCFSFGLNREPFCREEEFSPFRDLGGRTGGANSSCTFDHLAVATCDLVDVNLVRNKSIPIQFQYFRDPNLGGTLETMDFCPIHAAVPVMHCQRQRDLGGNVFLENVGPNSKCVDFEIRTSWEFNSTTLQPINGGACYEVSCAAEGNVTITVGENYTIICQSAGQEIIVPAEGFDIVIICPAFEDICWENSTTCPATTPTPPSGLSTGGAIAIGVVFGLLGVVAVAIIVAVLVAVVMHRQRGKKKYLSHRTQPDDAQGSYRLVGQGFLEKES